jgi:hypothetical protein
VASNEKESQSLQESVERHDPVRLAGMRSSLRQIRILAHNDEPVHREVLEHVEHVGVMLFEVVVSQEELSTYENGELDHRIKSLGHFIDNFEVDVGM